MQLQWIITMMTTKDGLSGLGSPGDVCAQGPDFWIFGLLTAQEAKFGSHKWFMSSTFVWFSC